MTMTVPMLKMEMEGRRSRREGGMEVKKTTGTLKIVMTSQIERVRHKWTVDRLSAPRGIR